MPFWSTTKQRRKYDPSMDSPAEKRATKKAESSPQAWRDFVDANTVSTTVPGPASSGVPSASGGGSVNPSDHAAQLIAQHHKAQQVLASLFANSPLTPAQQTFATVLSMDTGLSPKVVGAWLLGEESSEAAQEREAEGNHNWLNIGYTGSGPAAVTKAPEFWKDPVTAAHATSKWMKGEWGDKYNYNAADSIKTIPAAASANDQAQMNAIVNSGWAGSAYGGHLATYDLIPSPSPEALKALHSYHGSVGEPDNPLTFSGGPQDVRTAIDVIPKHKLFTWLQGTGGNTGNRENIAKLNPVFARHLLRAAIRSGEPLKITSGERSKQEQEEIAPGTNPAAPPGLSVHQFGGAADTEPTPEQVKLLEEEGIEHGFAGGAPDPPHTEFTDPRLIKRETKFGPVRSGYAPPGLEQAVGDLSNWSSEGASSGGAAPPSSSSVGAGSSSPSTIMAAAMENPQPEAAQPTQSPLSSVMSLLDSPVPSVKGPLQPMTWQNDELLKLAMRGRRA